MLGEHGEPERVEAMVEEIDDDEFGGDEKPGNPWLTPQATMPRSLTVLRVCAVADWAETPVARARAKTREARFMAKPFEGRPGTMTCRRRQKWAKPPPQMPTGQAIHPCSGSKMQRRSQQAPSKLQRSCTLYHRTTGGPGQGVDAGLLCPAINQKAVFRCFANFSC